MPIHLLAENVIAGISAGEVIERPASVVKELIENSLDAGATLVQVNIERGGTRCIRVSDDGFGIPRDEASLAFSRHATSKLSALGDLERIASFGFRGEALAAIAAAGEIEMRTRQEGSAEGTLVLGKAGGRLESRPAGCEKGTSLSVRNLFKNFPARLKFLKSPGAEATAAVRAVEPYALTHTAVHFVVKVDGEDKLNVARTDDLFSRLKDIVGSAAARMIPFAGQAGSIAVHGFVEAPGSVSGRGRLWLLVNSRPVEDKALRHALIASYRGQLPRDTFPTAVIYIDVPPDRLDINVHPTKSEVRFADQQSVYRLLADSIKSSFGDLRQIPTQSISSGMEQPAETMFIAGLEETAPRTLPVSSDRLSLWRPEKQFAGKDIEILAQLFDTYIVVRDSMGLLIIDQHAAHEKIVYERLRRARERKTSQALLMPITLEVSPSESMLLRARAAVLRELGIEYDEFGGKSIIIRAVPQQASEADVGGMIRHILEELQEAGKAPSDSEITQRLLATIACHMAVRANKHLTTREMEAIVHELFDLEDPLTCPHGRPTIVRMSETDLARHFRRI